MSKWVLIPSEAYESMTVTYENVNILLNILFLLSTLSDVVKVLVKSQNGRISRSFAVARYLSIVAIIIP